MKLHKLTLAVSPDENPDEIRTYTWTYGDEMFGLVCAVEKLNELLNHMHSPSGKAASATQPINDGL